jgi:hypothetical protein
LETQLTPFIDFSQHDKWWTCPWAWYENYIMGYQRAYVGQRDDALAFGSLVHDGLHNWSERNDPTISDTVVAEMTPKLEALQLAQSMVHEYVQRYPNEDFPIERCEQPVQFPLGEGCLKVGLAKLDAYFYIDRLTTLQHGLNGVTETIQPGWWIREYKTKDAGSRRDTWIKKWETNMQADFQMLALWALTGERPQGIIVQVLEKPRLYIPKRKCKGCKELYEMSTYIIAADGKYSCPMCGFVQELSAYEPKVDRHPEFYRVPVTRTVDELNASRQEIRAIADRMAIMETQGKGAELRNKAACVHFNFGECPYFEVHKGNLDISQGQGLVQIDPLKYVGLPKVA